MAPEVILAPRCGHRGTGVARRDHGAGTAVPNRLGGADANPYLALAASLACGYLGMVEGLKPSEPVSGSAYDLPFGLPRSLAESVRLLRDCRQLIDLLGDAAVAPQAAAALKKTLLMFDFFHDVAEKARDGNAQAKEVIQSWADAEPDPEVAKLLRQNGREEARHGERVNEVRRLLGMAV